jgi:hypothetical protein
MKGALTYGRVSPIFLIRILSSVHEFPSHDCLLFYLYGHFKRIEPSSPATVSLRPIPPFETNKLDETRPSKCRPNPQHHVLICSPQLCSRFSLSAASRHAFFLHGSSITQGYQSATLITQPSSEASKSRNYSNN